jgi:transposase InsO family protein
MNDKQTDSVVAALTTRIIHQFGPMEELSIDSAKEFESKQMDDWAKRNNVDIIKALAYNAQANAASERFYYPGDAGTDARITFEWNIQRKRGTGFHRTNSRMGRRQSRAL